MSDWRLEQPWVLALWVAVTLLLVWARWRRTEALPGGALVAGGGGRLRTQLPAWLIWLALAAAAVAWANPQHGETVTETERYGVAIVHVVDASTSMQALDFVPGDTETTRLQGAISVLRDFVQARAADLQALTVFGDEVMTLVPLTADAGLVREMALVIEPGIAGNATAIGDALALAVKRLRGAPVASKVVVLLSDGENSAGDIDPLEAARFAAAAGVRVYTIAIGRGGPVPVRVPTAFGTRIREVSFATDPESLRQIAVTTGGQAYAATDVNALREVYAAIDRLERSPYQARTSVAWRDGYTPWVWLAMICTAAALALVGLWDRRVPAA